MAQQPLVAQGLLIFEASVSHCCRTSVACCTTRYVKGLSSFNPLAFTHVPPEVTTSKLCEDLISGNSVLNYVYKIYRLFR